MSNTFVGSATPEKVKNSIPGRLEDLENSIRQLNEELIHLEQCLEPVLTPAVEAENPAAVAPPSSMSSFSMRIVHCEQDVEVVRYTLRRIRRALDF